MLKGKKVTAVILALIMSVMVLAGCQSSDSQNQADSNSNNNSSSTTGQEQKTDQPDQSGQSDQSAERETLVVAVAQHANVEDYETNHLTKLLEEELNIDLEFYYLPADKNDAKTKISTMVNSGDTLPDVIIGLNYGQSELVEFGSNGIFLALNDYYEDKELAQYFYEIPDEDREMIYQNMKCADGNIYTIPRYNAEEWNITPYRFWINRTWLDALNLETPTTTEEFASVMEHFLNDDPNQNGQKDEIPVTGSTGGWGTDSFYFLINAFEYYPGVGLTLSKDGKTVIAPFTTDAYREGLEYIRELCEKGLFSASNFTQDATQLTAVLSNEPQIAGGTAAGGYGYWADAEKSPNFQDMELLPPLVGPNGVGYAVHYTPSPAAEFVITKDCKNPELAFRFGDLFLRRDISITNRFGEEGVDWSSDPEITSQYKGMFEDISGIPCTFALLNDIWSKPQNKSWYDEGPCYRGTDFYRGVDERKPDDENAVNYYALTRAQSAVYYADAHPEHLIVNLVYTQEENDEIAGIMTDVSNYVQECNAAFVTGNMDMSEWENYLKELDNMGLQRWLEIGQIAYDRMQN